MITTDEALQEINRLNWLPRFPDPDAVKHLAELVKALQSAPSLDIAKAAVDDFAQGAIVCPLPATIRRMVQQHVERSTVAYFDNLAARPWYLPPVCSICKDTGFIVTTKPDGISGAEQCVCRKEIP